ncbi:OmpA/MotB family protein [Avibacterium avium]|uniref:OmpA/MotB family protein n=1 Tax=Avibacterium avium TaxID=751 RepID=UPI003BF8C5E6
MRLFSNRVKPKDDDNHYWISISDLMTSLLFIFILAFAYTIKNIQEDVPSKEMLDKLLNENRLLREKVDILVNENKELMAKLKKLEEQSLIAGENFKQRASFLVDIQKDLKQRNINVDIDPKNGNMRINSEVLFESGSAILKENGKLVIQEIAQLIREKLEDNPKYHSAIDTIFIEGHTDSTPFGRGDCFGKQCSNMELSSQRAINTYIYMDNSSHISELKNISGRNLFSYSGYADTRPIDGNDNSTFENRAKNRRIEFFFALHNPSIK